MSQQTTHKLKPYDVEYGKGESETFFTLKEAVSRAIVLSYELGEARTYNLNTHVVVTYQYGRITKRTQLPLPRYHRKRRVSRGRRVFRETER